MLHVVMQLLEYKISDVATGNGSKFLAHLFRESIFDVGFPRCQCHHQACAFKNLCIGRWWIGVESVEMCQ